jgi:hypothetical protein
LPQADQVTAQFHAGGVIAGVVAHPRDRNVRHRVAWDHVFDAHFDRLAADGTRHLINRPFHREAGAGPADAAIRPKWCLIGSDGDETGAVIRKAVRAGQAARRHVGLLVRALRPQPIGAGIDDNLRLDAEELAAPVGVGGQLVVLVAGMCRGQQVLVAIFQPADREIDFERQRRQDDLFRIQPRLWPKPATDIGRHDAQPV